MSRTELLAAVKATQPLTSEWEQAVRALGAGSRAGFPRPRKPTGLSRGELYHRMLRSHVFDADRTAWQSKWWASPSAACFDALKNELAARKQAEKLTAA